MPDDSRKHAAAHPGETNFSRWLDTLIPALFANDAAFARALGTAQGTVHRWRRGTIPSVPWLLRISEVTGTDVAQLLKIAGYGEDPRERWRRKP